MYDPFIKLTHLWSDEGGHRSSPIYLLPDKVREFYNGKVYMDGNYSFVVCEKAEQIRKLVVEKLAENRQADALGK